MAILLKGAPVASAITQQAAINAASLAVVPTLAIIRIGQRPDDMTYEKNAIRHCEKTGVHVRPIRLSDSCTQEELLSVIRQVNQDSSIHGCLMLRPLPPHLDDEAACAALDPRKDVDGITTGALAGLFTGFAEGCPPCTAEACMALLEHYQIDPAGKHAVVLGRSLVVGKPVAMLLLSRNATVTICHSKTQNMPQICQQAEILIASAGVAHMVDKHFLSKGQVVLDVGIHPTEHGLWGDVDPQAAEEQGVYGYSPTPGGIGAVTTALLAAHTVELARRIQNRAALPSQTQ